jgi:hypothetical protein
VFWENEELVDAGTVFGVHTPPSKEEALLLDGLIASSYEKDMLVCGC